MNTKLLRPLNQTRLLSYLSRFHKPQTFFSTSSYNLNKNKTFVNDLTKLKPKVKCCSANIPPVVELGQPTFWTHQHMFDESEDQVTPGLSKQEFANRRDIYVKNLTTYQSYYFKTKNNSNQNNNFIAIIPSAMTAFMAPDVP